MTDLQALKQKRLKWVEANHENGFDEGINRLLTELYPYNAHFIYELLQNAEDPKATEVCFNLTDSAVEFKHNGKRLFTLKDVESITSIGNSTKRDDETSIGKFGVGFKAVFAYTNSPEIHSGDFHFRIHDLVVPETKGISKLAIDDQTTRFIFPFDNPKKSANISVTETEKGLRNLGDNTLLFLSHIRKIDYTLPSGETGYLQRIDHENGRIEIRSQHPDGIETISHWLHFQKEVVVIDDNFEAKRCNIAIAYSLVEEANKKGGSSAWKIVPLEQGQVSIYFPAEKETSNLRFHLHAPFASTVARDSVRDCSANHQLRDRIAELIVESLISIRDQGLLTVSFLAVLPNSRDNLIEFYQPIQMAIVKAFEEEALTPTKNKSHAKYTELFRGPTKITGVISDKDLKRLTEYADGLWVANPPPQSQREEAFLDALDINSWGWTELAKTFRIIDPEDKLIIEEWLQQKDIKWVITFYALLGEACSSQRKSISVSNIKIVLVETEVGGSYVLPSQAFFPATEKITPPNNIRIVNKLTYDSGRSDENKRLAKLFLEKIGVRPFDIKASIEHKLNGYDYQNKITNGYDYDYQNKITKGYLSDIKLFVSYWRKTSDINIFKDHIFLRGWSQDRLFEWQVAHEIYLDTPYADTGLRNLFNDASITIEKYKIELLEEYQSIPNFIDFAVALGVMTELTIIEVSIGKNYKWQTQEFYSDIREAKQSNSNIQEDYSIDKLEEYIANNSVVCSRLIWNALIKAPPETAKARYRPNAKHYIRIEDSQLVYHLKNNAWIPNKKGVFCKPQDMLREDLPDDFVYNNSNGLLTAIGFGENAKIRTEEYQAKNNKAQEFGFSSVDRAEKWAELDRLGLSPDELLQKQKHTEQPEESAPNPERRRKNAVEQSNNASSKESIIRERSIQLGITNVVADAKAYLREKYTNNNKELVCQCCQKEMPFKVNDAYYFEAVQCIKELKKHLNENRLALCPTCAAMYQYARETDDAEMCRLIVKSDVPSDSSSIEIPITLAAKKYMLRFVETHWIDLKANVSPLND